MLKFRSSSKVKPKYATLGAYSMAQVMYVLSFKSGCYVLCTKQVLLFVQTVVWIVLLIMACPSNAEDYRGFLYKPAQYKRFL